MPENRFTIVVIYRLACFLFCCRSLKKQHYFATKRLASTYLLLINKILQNKDLQYFHKISSIPSQDYFWR